MLTRLMKIIRSSGTPCSMSTSTAFMAEPPVADIRRYESGRDKKMQDIDQA